MTKMSALVKHIRPTDFPRTEAKTAFALKESLARQFNYARQHPKQMEALVAQLTFMLAKTTEWDRAYDQLKLQAAARGESLEPTKNNFIMTGGGARHIQAQRAVTINAQGERHVPELVVSSDVQPTGTSVPASIPPVNRHFAATVNNDLGHGFIKIGMETGTQTVDAQGRVGETEQVHTPKVAQPLPAGVQTIDINAALQVNQPFQTVPVQPVQMVQPLTLPTPGMTLPPPMG